MAVIGDLWNGKGDGRPIGYFKVLPAPRVGFDEVCAWVEIARTIQERLDSDRSDAAAIDVARGDAYDLAYLILGMDMFFEDPTNHVRTREPVMTDLVARARVIARGTDGEGDPADRVYLTA
jgi:hypothetical protein